MAYRPYRGRRRRGSGWGFALGALAAGSMVLAVTWYLHVPVPSWIGSRNVEAVSVPVAEPVLLPPAPPARTADSYLVEGDNAFQRGDWRTASDAYERAVQLDPTIGQAQVRWTRALIAQHRVNEAVEQGRRAIAVLPDNAEARAGLAVALDWSGQVDRALQTALSAVEKNRRSAPAWAAVAEVYADLYRLREADEALDEALHLAPNDPEVARVQGVIFETRADYPAAVDAYVRAAELAPRWSYLQVSLGHAYRVQGQYDEALDAFAKAVELSPTDARAEAGRGMVYRARDEFDHAAGRFQRAIELDPTYSTAYAQLAWIHYARREYDRAEPLFVRAIELDRDAGRLAQYRHALGWIYLSAKRTGEAREQFTRALELNPNLQGAKDGLAMLQPAQPAAAPRRR
ncbi:MAG: tetratricopeptide repeat protein [Chloroflexi bacterium]|nr:tetratricopeptide repeat protein [Chloroflexota bacterium]